LILNRLLSLKLSHSITMSIKTLCVLALLVAVAAADCNNGIKDADEAGVDCGSNCFALCAKGTQCKTDFDCESWNCENSVCSAATHSKRFLGASGSAAPSPASLGSASTITINVFALLSMIAAAFALQ
jgi:hypothetical protein